MDDRSRLIELSRIFLKEVKNKTTSLAVERWLNETYGPGTPFYAEMAGLIAKGVSDGWAANIEIDGPRYRRSLICAPEPGTSNFSITAVYMDSKGNAQDNPEESYRGQYHAHPYGEFNMVVPLDKGAALAGPSGWCHAGWTAPQPGSHHFPEVKGGAVIALFFLPAGRISYDLDPAEVAADPLAIPSPGLLDRSS